MQILLIITLIFLVATNSNAQLLKSKIIIGKYEGVERRYYNVVGDTGDFAEKQSRYCCKKTLILDSNGTFYFDFSDYWPRQSQVTMRITNGNWEINNDTLILNSKYQYKNFIRVKESHIKNLESGIAKIQIRYKKSKKYFPNLDIEIGDYKIKTENKPWISIQSRELRELKIFRRNSVSDREWFYRIKNINSNYLKIRLIAEIERNNFVLENYKLLIKDKDLIQIEKKEFDLINNKYTLSNFP
jgi:hypothetical protein